MENKFNSQSEVDLKRTWKGKAYRQSLTPEQLVQLSLQPGDEIELDEEALAEVSGGTVGAGPLFDKELKRLY